MPVSYSFTVQAEVFLNMLVGEGRRPRWDVGGLGGGGMGGLGGGGGGGAGGGVRLVGAEDGMGTGIGMGMGMGMGRRRAGSAE